MRDYDEQNPFAVIPEPLPDPVDEVMEVQERIDVGQGVLLYRGRLREPAEDAFRDLKQRLPAGVVPLLRSEPDGKTSIVLMPRQVEGETLEKRPNRIVPVLLFIATLITTTMAGAAQAGVNVLAEPWRFTAGLPYALALMGILGTHELGHYFAARYHRMNVTVPYFIPAPFSLGTFGAFIRMKSPPEDRTSLFDVAVAGPLAGLVIAIPALFFGLQGSEIAARASLPNLDGTMRPSLAVAAMIKAALGDAIRSGDVLKLSPLAFAGWLGLLLTGLNLMPIGQLDGGHTARAMFGAVWGTRISMVAMALLALAALTVAPQLLFWAMVVFFMGTRGAPPLNDVTSISRGRLALGIFTLLIFVAIMLPAF